MTKRSVSFVFPMYNEAENIEETLEKACQLASELSHDYEIVLVDDASTDGCADIAGALAVKNPRIKVIRLAKNTKFGGALAGGLKSASKEVIIYTDSDFPVKEEDVRKAFLLLDHADIVTGYSLVIKDASFKRIIMSKGYNFLVHSLFGLELHDINSGFKIYKREVFADMELRSRSPFIDAEIFIEALKRKFKIRQYGLIFELRTKGKSMIAKPSIVARTFWDMIAYKFSR